MAGPEAFSLAGALAASTDMDVGIAVVAATTRTPALLAMGGLTLATLGNPRKVTVGVGSSSRAIVEGWHGGAFDPPLAKVRETVLATRLALQGERSFTGEFVRFSGLRLALESPEPVRLAIGALGPRMLQLAGEIADTVCLNLMPPEIVPRQLAEVRTGAGDRDLDDFEVMARLHVLPTDDLDEGRRRFREGFGAYFAQPVYNRFLAWCGFPDEAAAVATAFEARDRDGVAAALHDDVVDAIGLIGSPGRIIDRLDAFDEAGVDVAALNILVPDEDVVARTLAAVADR